MPASRRKPPTMADKLAAALLAVPGLIPESMRKMSAKTICAFPEWHHYPIAYADGGPNGKPGETWRAWARRPSSRHWRMA